MATNVHVVPDGEHWAVECEGHPDEKQPHRTQHDAISATKFLAKEEPSELLVHGSDGRIQPKWSYGHDPRNIPG